MARVKPTSCPAVATPTASAERDTSLARVTQVLSHASPSTTAQVASGSSLVQVSSVTSNVPDCSESSEKRQKNQPWYSPGDSVGPRLFHNLSRIPPSHLAEANRTAPDALATAMTDGVAQVLLKTVANQINLGKAEEKLKAETEEKNKVREETEREVKAANDTAEKERAEMEAMREKRDESRRRREAMRAERDGAVAEAERLRAERRECAAAREEVAKLKAFMDGDRRQGSVPHPVYWMGVRDCRAKVVLDNPDLDVCFSFRPPNP